MTLNFLAKPAPTTLAFLSPKNIFIFRDSSIIGRQNAFAFCFFL